MLCYITWLILMFIFVPDVAVDREVEGDLLQGDMGYGMPFRPGTFDGAVRLVYNTFFRSMLN